MTGLTIIGLHFYKSYYNGVAHFQDFGGQKIQVCRLTNASVHFRMTKLKGFKGRYILNRKWLSWDHENYFFPKVTKMGSIIWPQNRL